jgi:hypothetical protein
MIWQFWLPSESGFPNPTDRAELQAVCPHGVEAVPSPGPGGERGTLCWNWGGPGEWRGYKPEAQRWTERGGIWYGSSVEALPVPVSVERKDKPALHYSTVNIEGREWQVPILRSRMTGACALPQRSRVFMDEEGQVRMIQEIHQDYRAIWEKYIQAESDITTKALGQDPAEGWHQNVHLLPLRLLEVGYAVNYEMLQHSGIWLDQNPGNIIEAAMGLANEFPVSPIEVE